MDAPVKPTPAQYAAGVKWLTAYFDSFIDAKGGMFKESIKGIALPMLPAAAHGVIDAAFGSPPKIVIPQSEQGENSWT